MLDLYEQENFVLYFVTIMNIKIKRTSRTCTTRLLANSSDKLALLQSQIAPGMALLIDEDGYQPPVS
jgi:hypothetical protein